MRLDINESISTVIINIGTNKSLHNIKIHHLSTLTYKWGAMILVIIAAE